VNVRVRLACGLWLVASAVASGCAGHRAPHTNSNPFVKPGNPTVEIGKPVKMAKGSGASRRPVAHVRPASSASLLPTVESSDPTLSAALLSVVIAATPDAHRVVAERYRELGILDMAYDHFLRASQLDRTDASAYEGLARIWRDWGFPRLGLGDASRAVYYAPSSASAHNTWGTVLAAAGQPREARREYERAVQLDPRAAYAWNNLCYLSFLEGDAPTARVECQTALSMDPALAAAQGTLASLERREARDRVP
jgi:Flp pilus assembly protein TadD